MRLDRIRLADFWRYVDKGVMFDDCWLWLGSRSDRGYGSFVDIDTGTIYSAYRHAWTLTHGPIQKATHLCHKCDNPPCVNPLHLFEGTQADNMRDRMRKTFGINDYGDNPNHELAAINRIIREEWPEPTRQGASRPKIV